jgi:hypothetical protein
MSRGIGDVHEGTMVVNAPQSTESDGAQGQAQNPGRDPAERPDGGPADLSTSSASRPLDSPATAVTATPSAQVTLAKDMALESLTPKFVKEQHDTYLRRLKEAAQDTDNLNIAVTGRYGAGKSSVLDEFAKHEGDKVLRLAISTLAPGEEGESTTNRIQKEIVKQLLYGASKKVGRFSRFNKIAALDWTTAAWQSALVVVPLGLVAYVFGLLPDLAWPPKDAGWGWRLVVWVLAAAVLTGLGAVVRMFTYDRVNVSDVSAGGAALTLTATPKTFFDKYIDEIVHYFTQESKDYVIFEDLDRFEDPYIFEALRELNVLLNNTPERRRKADGTNGEKPPLRFIYAVRDSVFSQIDSAPAPKQKAKAGDMDNGSTESGSKVDTAAAVPGDTHAIELDEVAAETQRANRTKFFDVVIPLVPFISHRNARDLLARLLEERGILGIEPRLVNTVARHCTDMRLMRNMCNEYLVFAERLLEPVPPAKTAPGLSSTHLFALVAYKNFHLEDFEKVTRRDSDLDRLYDFSQRLVRENIAALNERRRELEAEEQRVHTRAGEAARMGNLLTRIGVAEVRNNNFGWTVVRYRVGETMYPTEDTSSYAFWLSVAEFQTIAICLVPNAQTTNGQVLATLESSDIAAFFPGALTAQRWDDIDEDEASAELAELEASVDLLRSASFEDLVNAPASALVPTAAEAARLTPTLKPEQSRNFAQLAEATLKSKLAVELVRRGYLDRNFSLYAAQFYGNFSGVDVATFMVQHVQPNAMSIYYDLSRPRVGNQEGAVANLLVEAEDAGEELLETVAAWNIDIVNHLLRTDEDAAAVVVGQLITNWGSKDAHDFLSAYFTSEGAERIRLAELLAACRWRHVYTYFGRDVGVPPSARTALFNAALSGFDPYDPYVIDDDVRAYLTDHYRDMDVLTGDQPLAQAVEVRGHGADDPSERPLERVTELLRRFDVTFAQLAPLRSDVRARVVAESRYQLTADNLRTALGLPDTGSIAMEEVRADEDVYENCSQNLTVYLAAVDGDEHTDHAITTPETLVIVLGDLVADYEAEENADPVDGKVAELLRRTSANARVRNLHDAPEPTWTALAAANLFRASLANLEAYRAAHGQSVDEYLADLLQHAGDIHLDEDGDTTDVDGEEIDRQLAAIAVLNAKTLSTQDRVSLASTLVPATPLPVHDIGWEASDLFALLLRAGLVADDELTFTHLRAGGWAALGPSVKVSGSIESFLSPTLLEGMVGDALDDSETAAKVAGKVLADVNEYVSEDDWPALRAVAMYADKQSLALDPAVVVRIARIGDGHGDRDAALMLGLLDAASPTAVADHVVETFLHLGEPYNLITTSGQKFDVDYDDLHDRLLRVLDSADLISRSTLRVPRHRHKVTVK